MCGETARNALHGFPAMSPPLRATLDLTALLALGAAFVDLAPKITAVVVLVWWLLKFPQLALVQRIICRWCPRCFLCFGGSNVAND
jgi:hypothetical protein